MCVCEGGGGEREKEKDACVLIDKQTQYLEGILKTVKLVIFGMTRGGGEG